MPTSIDGFYAAYLTGSASQGFAMLIFRNGRVVGIDAAGVKFDGTYSGDMAGFVLNLTIGIPPNTALIQGVSSGPQVESYDLEFQLPLDFLSRSFIRINARHGPINAKITRLRELND